MKKFQQRQRTPRSTRRRSSGRLLSGTQGASSRLSIGGAKNGTTTTTTTSAANDIAVEEIRRSTMQAASQNKINLKTANFIVLLKKSMILLRILTIPVVTMENKLRNSKNVVVLQRQVHKFMQQKWMKHMQQLDVL